MNAVQQVGQYTRRSSDSAMRRPAKPQRITVAQYLDQQIKLCGKSQLDIAQEAGFNKPNIITMIKQGRTKLPLSKIGPMAKALGVDKKFLYQLVMREYEPETWAMLEQDIFENPVISEAEYELIKLARQGNIINPVIRTDEERRRVLDVLATLRPENATKD